MKGEELNRNGETYVERQREVRVKVVDGSSLAAAVVTNSIPNGTPRVVMRGRLTKVAYTIASALCQRGIQVTTLRREEYEKLRGSVPAECRDRLVHLNLSSKVLSSHKVI